MAEDKMQTITDFFKKVKFKKKLIGGVDEADVWAKLDKLQKEYRRLYEMREAELQAVIDYQESLLIRKKSAASARQEAQKNISSQQRGEAGNGAKET